MTITRTFKLCLNAGTGSAPYINVNQYDSGEQWLFELYQEDGTRYIPSSGAIIGLKADGKAIANDGTVDSEGRVVITETKQMTAAAGRGVFELSIDSNTHGTANFIVKAERKPTDDAEFSDSDLSMFQTVIDASEVINEVIGEGGDPSQRITDAVDDWLEAHPEATTTVQDGAITVPKINSSLWDKLLVSESASGSVASFDDGADGVPVKSLIAHINPVQSGSGDPSPTNVRPISGHSSVTVDVNGTSYPYSLGQTVYGGYVDLATGVLSLTKGYKIYDGTETWFTEFTYNFYANTGRGRGEYDYTFLCSHFKYNYIGGSSTDTSKMPSGFISSGGNFNIQRADIEHTAEAMKAWCLQQYQNGTPLTVVFDLTTPTTIQLTPQEVTSLLGENNISADTGEVEVIYRADTKLYIDEQTKATKGIIAGVETSFTATKNYTVGNLLIVGDDLYRVTANIANGSAITVNTNVVQTTVAEQLLALA